MLAATVFIFLGPKFLSEGETNLFYQDADLDGAREQVAEAGHSFASNSHPDQAVEQFSAIINSAMKNNIP